MKITSMKITKIAAAVMVCSLAGLLAACGGGSSNNSSSTTTTSTNTIASTGSNVAPITVNLGAATSEGIDYANGAFITVTVCVPGTSNCQSIDGVLVDTGSYGLRLLSSVLTIALPQQQNSSGDPMAECLQFLDSYTWGPVETADIELASEKASSAPIQVLTYSGFIPPGSSACASSSGSADTLETLGANGILGVGLFPQDCGEVCVQPSATQPTPPDAYYECPTTGCTASWQALNLQVQNPVSLFPTDKNGVILELPAVSGAEASVSGSLVFGIGTESNNTLGSATVYTVDPTTGNFSTNFNGASYTDAAFIDSGSNAYFFPDTSIAACSSSSGAEGFYCPSSTVNLSATTLGYPNGNSGTVNFSVENAQTLFGDNPSDAAYADLGGPVSSGANSSPAYFDWGLPFFYGRNVFVAIDGTTAPGGTTPYWAY
jgi:hypothetical protein